jgi:hypothetical protein
MKFRTSTLTAVMTLLAATLAIPVRLAAQDNQDHHRKHHHYKLVDMGTFGGPQSIVLAAGQVLNNQGMVAGCADTPTHDPNFPNFNPFLSPTSARSFHLSRVSMAGGRLDRLERASGRQ